MLRFYFCRKKWKDIMLCIYSRRKRCAISDKKVITLMEMLWNSLYFYIQSFSFFKKRLLLSKLISVYEGIWKNGKIKSVRGESVWVGLRVFRWVVGTSDLIVRRENWRRGRNRLGLGRRDVESRWVVSPRARGEVKVGIRVGRPHRWRRNTELGFHVVVG